MSTNEFQAVNTIATSKDNLLNPEVVLPLNEVISAEFSQEDLLHDSTIP